MSDNDYIKCHKCKYEGPVLHFIFLYNRTWCPACLTKKLMNHPRR